MEKNELTIITSAVSILLLILAFFSLQSKRGELLNVSFYMLTGDDMMIVFLMISLAILLNIVSIIILVSARSKPFEGGKG